MWVQKSYTHRIVTIEHGSFFARETVRFCVARCRTPSGTLVTRRSEILPRWVKPGCVNGFDIEVHVGIQRFIRHRQREEIREELKSRYGFFPSTGEVSTLEARFLEHLEALHLHRAPAFREALARDGGYPLHIDATGEDGRGTLFVTYAGWRGWVLGSRKLSTERADQILPHLRAVLVFGVPRAVLRDLGKAVIQAAQDFVAELGCDIPIISCHQHFLADVGEDLLEASHDAMRNLFRRFRLRPKLRTLARDLGRRLGPELSSLRNDVMTWAEGSTEHQLPEGLPGLAAVRSLAQWVLDYDNDGDHLGFPFDQPYLDFYERCRMARRATDAFLRRPLNDTAAQRHLKRLARILDRVISEPAFSQVARTLSFRANLFDELRAALRLSPKSSQNRPDQNAVPPQRAAAELQDIRKALTALTRSLRRRRPQRGPALDSRKAIDLILTHLKKHGSSLWGHVIQLPKRVGGGIRVVARTNNCLEGFFHRMKHAERRRSGRKVLSRDFEVLPAAAAYAYNLTCPEYVKILCGSLEKLPQAFSALESSIRARSQRRPFGPLLQRLPDPETFSASFPQADRHIVRAMPLQRWIEGAARSRAPRYEFASN